MKAILEFSLPEDGAAYRVACDAPRYREVLRHVDEYLRTELKHKVSEATRRRALQDVREVLRATLMEYGLFLDEE